MPTNKLLGILGDRVTIRTFDFCALQFLNQWLEKEASYCISLASSDIATQRQALGAAGAHFRVARNLPRKYESERNLQRYQPVLDILNELEDVTPSNMVEIVENTRQRISSEYGQRNVLSLTTKFLWLKIKSPIRVYDRQARIVLGTPDGDFAAFNDAFTAKYAESQSQIEKACGKLVDMVSYSVQPNMQQSELRDLVSSQWFKERVLDIYLWNQGST